MSKIVFMLEEPSMAAVLDVILPKVLPAGVDFLSITHDGKSDLDKSIPRKLRAWQEPGVRFVIVRDKDSEDCQRLKKRLKKLCDAAKRPDTLIRIACHELESWFLGDLTAVGKAFGKPKLGALAVKQKFRNPDLLPNACEELRSLISEYQKIGGARAIAPCMDLGKNNSHSFNVFLAGVRRIASTAIARTRKTP